MEPPLGGHYIGRSLLSMNCEWALTEFAPLIYLKPTCIDILEIQTIETEKIGNRNLLYFSTK